MRGILFTQLTATEIENLIEKTVQNQVEDLKKLYSEQMYPKKEFLTRNETAAFFSVTVTTIHSWVNKGLIIPLKMGNKTFFERSHLIEKLMSSNNNAA